MAPSRALFGVPSSAISISVDLGLVLGIEADDRIRDLAVDRADRLLDALPAPASLVAVAKLDRFMRARRCARRDRRAAHASVFQRDVNLDRRVAAAVEDLAGVDVDDRGHGNPSCAKRNDLVARCTYRRRVGPCNFRSGRQERRSSCRVEVGKEDSHMGDNRTDLPEGTDTVIAGASPHGRCGQRRNNGESIGDRNEDPCDPTPRRQAARPASRAAASDFPRSRPTGPAASSARASNGLPKPWRTSASWSAIRPTASMSG